MRPAQVSGRKKLEWSLVYLNIRDLVMIKLKELRIHRPLPPGFSALHDMSPLPSDFPPMFWCHLHSAPRRH